VFTKLKEVDANEDVDDVDEAEDVDDDNENVFRATGVLIKICFC
jgi:hypothetical protein